MKFGEELGRMDAGHWVQNAQEAHPRAVGAPLPVGQGRTTKPIPDSVSATDEAPAYTDAPPPGRSLHTPASSEPFSLQRALNMAMPFVQKLLPILDGNIASAVAGMIAPHPQPPASAPVVNLAPIEDSLTELQAQQNELRGHILDQNTSLKRVEDQLEMVREATDRNTLEQQELMEDLKAVGSKVNFFAYVMLLLLAASVVLNVVLYLHILRVLP